MSTGAVEIDVEARRVRVAGGEWRGWFVYEALALGDGETGRLAGFATDSCNGRFRGLDPMVYRAFFNAGEASAAPVAQGTGGEAA
jgi:hypothetical protein